MSVDRFVRLKSCVRQIYGGRSLKPGDPFPAPVPERTARGLLTNHFAVVDDGVYEDRVMRTANSAPVARKRGRPKGSYNRRDMRAKA